MSGSRLSIGLFGLFVVITLLITYFASRMTRTIATLSLARVIFAKNVWLVRASA